jgi:hypothetical protein
MIEAIRSTGKLTAEQVLMCDGSPASESHAVSWLLQNSSLLKPLLQLALPVGGSSVPDTACKRMTRVVLLAVACVTLACSCS